MNTNFLKQFQFSKLVLGVASAVLLFSSGCTSKQSALPSPAQSQDDYAIIARAFLNKQSGILVQAHGVVGQILSDDPEPPRHQRFIVRLPSGQILLVAHNIDVAARINDLKSSTPIYFRGEYIFGEKGGTIHKTHHDPTEHIPSGWIEYNGKKYE